MGWWAISNGCDVLLPDGTTMATVKGDMFRIGEWYGSTGKTNEASEHAGYRQLPLALSSVSLRWGFIPALILAQLTTAFGT
ncbi:hypothetical protein [Stenotrophomonas phage CM2]